MTSWSCGLPFPARLLEGLLLVTGPFKVTIAEDDASMRRSLERLLSIA